MIADASRYVERAKGRYRYTFRRFEIHCFWFLTWLKPGGQGNPPLSGPRTNGMGPFRRKKAKGLGITCDMGIRRKMTSNSPPDIRPRSWRQAYHSKATENG